MRCIVCNTRHIRPTPMIFKENMFQTYEEFEYIKCSACSSISIKNIPEFMDQYYPKDYNPHASAAKQTVSTPHAYMRAMKSLFFSAPHSYLPKHLRSTARILDFGAGNGNAALSAFEMGFPRVTAIDAFAPIDRSYHWGALKVERKSTTDFPDNTFDFVMSHHVLEHVKDPYWTLSELRRITKKGGVILIRVPFCDSTNAMRYGEHWAGFDSPRHLHNFSTEGLLRLAWRCDLAPTHIFYDEALYGHWMSKVWQEGGNIADYNSTADLVKKFGVKEVNDWYVKCNEHNRDGCGDAGGVYMRKDK